MLVGVVSIIFLSLIVLGVFVILQRASIVDVLVGFVCATLPLEWLVEVRGVNLSVYDVAFGLSVPIFLMVILKHRYYRNRQVYKLLVLFLVFQLWNLIAQFAHSSGRGPFQTLWSDYKNYSIGLIFLLAGIVLASRPQHIQRQILLILLAAFAFEACVGIVQTASGGLRLNSNITGRYLGFLTPVPASGIANSLFELQGDGTLDNGTFVGSIFRAIGTHRQSNYFAVSMIAGLGVCLGVLSVKQHHWLHRWAIGVGCLLLAALGLSFTRTGYVALIAMCAWQFVFWSTAAMRRKAILLIGVAILSLALLPLFVSTDEIQSFINTRIGSVAFERVQNVFRPNEAREFSLRSTLWIFALTRVQSSPLFGVGSPIKLTDIAPTLLIPDRDLPLHNQVVSSIYYGGYVAGALYVIIHLWLIWISRKARPQAKELPILNMWVVAANLCLVGLAVESITIDWMPFTSLQGMFWLLAGIAAMQYRTAPLPKPTLATLGTHPPAVPAGSLVAQR